MNLYGGICSDLVTYLQKYFYALLRHIVQKAINNRYDRNHYKIVVVNGLSY